VGPTSRRAAVDGVSVLLLTGPGGGVVDEVLDALGAQSARPDQVVLTGLAPDSPEAARAQAHPITRDGVEVLLRPPATGVDHPLAASVNDALHVLPDDPRRWVWVLHDDSLPQPDALAALLEPVRRSSRVGVVGPKLVRRDDPRVLLGVGHRVTRGGRSADDGPERLVDQGQFDTRTDVIGVPLAGMLVRSDVLAEVGGVEPAFDQGTEGLDLSWRSHLRGHRVVVAPQAVVAQGDHGPGVTSPVRHRRRLRQVALARGSWWRTPARAAGIALAAALSTLALLLLKRPQEARAELADLTAVLAPGRSTAARWRFRGRRTVRERDLQGLFAPAGAAWRGTGETLQEALSPRPAGEASEPARRGVETGPVGEEVVALDDDVRGRARRWSWWLAAAVVLAAVVSVARWREIWAGLAPAGDGVRGGELLSSGAGADDAWALWALPWTGSGLGSAGQGPPWVLPLAGLAWVAEHLPGGPGASSSVDVVTAWLLWAALPAACVCAYAAARVATRRRGVRAVAALAWVGLAPLAVGVDEGRVGPVVLHVLAPLVVAGVVAAMDSSVGGRTGTTLAAATVLVVGIAAWFVPAVLVWTCAMALVMLVRGPHRVRWRGLAIGVLPPLLLGPWLRVLWDEPLLVLAGAGAGTVQGAVPAWQALLLHPGGPVPPVLWWTAPLWLLAVAAVLWPDPGGRRAGWLLVGALVALAGALASPWVHLGVTPSGYAEAGQAVTLWPGVFLSLVGAALLGAAVLAVEPVLHGRPRAARPPLRALAGAVSVLAMVAAAASAGVVVWRAVGSPDPTLAVASPAVPAVVAEQASGPTAVRWLSLTTQGPAESYAVRYALRGTEVDPWVRDRVDESTVTARSTEPASAAVEELVGVEAAGAVGDAPGAALAALAVGYVHLDAEEDHPLVTGLERVPGLTRISAPQGGVLWRVTAGEDAPDAVPGRVRVLDPAGDQVAVLGVRGSHSQVSADVPQGGAGGRLVVSEGAGWPAVAQVRADGDLVPARPGWPPTYDLPEDVEQVEVELPLADRAWWVATAALAALVGFLALPVGGSRREGRTS
jgi:GT2 family glycosyltransferase